MVEPGVGDNDQAGLLEGASDVVGEISGGKAASDRLGTGVGSEFENSTMTVSSRRDHTDVIRVFYSGDDTGSKNKLLPCLSDIDDVDT